MTDTHQTNYKSYSELVTLDTIEERFAYLRLVGRVGADTFGFDRYLNQTFYRSSEWRRVRNQVIVRDNGCDLGISGYEIRGHMLVHHMNPMTPEDLASGNITILEPEYLITTTHDTHNAIHYGGTLNKVTDPTTRKPGDTKLW